MSQREKAIKDVLNSYKKLLEGTTLGAWDIYYTLGEEFLEKEKDTDTGAFKVHIRIPKVFRRGNKNGLR